MKKRVVAIVFLTLLTGVGLLVYFGQHKVRTRELYYSGTIEATNSELAFQVGGRVSKVLVKEGEVVESQQVLAELDRSEYQSRYEQAKANLKRAEKNKEQLKILLAIYEKTLPADVTRAEANVVSAKVVLEEARRNKLRYEQLYEERMVSEKEKDVVSLHYDTASARLTESEAVLKQAVSNLQKIKASEKEIEAADAQINSSRAALEQTELQMDYTSLRAPYKGIIISKNVEVGEVVSPGRQVLTLSDLSMVDLKIFVGETEIGKVKPGQDVDVKVDTFPSKIYKGKVSFISPEAEFTPKIIQTHKERVKLVYLVKVAIPNANLELKSGMPADAWLR